MNTRTMPEAAALGRFETAEKDLALCAAGNRIESNESNRIFESWMTSLTC
jgi:Na+-transporting NADH:ubiquinone oxidoreductase subunit NqrA